MYLHFHHYVWIDMYISIYVYHYVLSIDSILSILNGIINALVLILFNLIGIHSDKFLHTNIPILPKINTKSYQINHLHLKIFYKPKKCHHHS